MAPESGPDPPAVTVPPALRAVYNDGASLSEHVSGLMILAAWAALSFVFAVKTIPVGVMPD
jgi:hypothetical protein